MDEDVAIVFAPDLGISAEDFAEAWNTASDAPATAEVIYPKSVGFNIPPELIESGMIALGVVSGAVGTMVVKPTTEAVAAFVKARVTVWLERQFPDTPPPDVQVSTITQDDGAVLFIVQKGA